jgi:glutamate synthase (ferredoxin)
MLAHNGEINTLLGNINWVKSREFSLSNLLPENYKATMFPEKSGFPMVRGPLVDVSRSDSANLDSTLESYVRAGRQTEEALMILVPEAYQNQPRLQNREAVKDFYSYYEAMQEAWDGPALLVFSDGNSVGAALDRNGLRPARYMITSDAQGKQNVHVMSEVGVTKALQQFAGKSDSPQKGLTLIDSGRLGPGEMLSVDLKAGKFALNEEIKDTIASKRPYKQWAEKSIAVLPRLPFNGDVANFANKYVIDPAAKAAALALTEKDTAPVAMEEGQKDDSSLAAMQTLFGWGTEDVEVQIHSMASEAIEATYCMGDDAPLAALSVMPHTLYDYFKQRFAQVTNPPIDPLREGAVMSLTMFLGPRGDPLSKDGQQDRRVRIESPILNAEECVALSNIDGVRMTTLPTLYPITDALSVGGLERAIEALCESALHAVRNGATILNLSDMMTAPNGYQGMTYIPPLLAVGAVHHKLIDAGLRTRASIIATTGSAWSTHHFACLIGFGASAVVPYAAYDAITNWHSQKRIQNSMEKGEIAKNSAAKAMYNFRKAADKGLLKILSKMGISLLTSYHGAQIFEALGLADNVIHKAFKGTPCRVAGLSFDDIAAETVEFARKAYGDAQFENIAAKVEDSGDGKIKKLFNYGFLNFFKSGDYHHNNQVGYSINRLLTTVDFTSLLNYFISYYPYFIPTAFDQDLPQCYPQPRRGPLQDVRRERDHSPSHDSSRHPRVLHRSPLHPSGSSRVC